METKQLKKILEDKTEELKNLHAERNRWAANFQQMRTEFDHQIQIRDAEIEHWKLKTSEASQKLTEIREDREKLHDQIRIAQEGAFRSMKDASWIPKEDPKVRDELFKLEERIRLWAKRYAVPEISALDHISTVEKNTIVQQLDEYCVQNDWDTLIKRMRPTLQKRIPVLFTHAMLAKDIFENIFANPFSGFAEGDKNSSMPSTAKMSYLYEFMMQGKSHLTQNPK